MGKKVKSKQRLDKFYHFAKEQGYRSRAAFKLIQLNRKYSFLNNANVLVDLCAAPGGWLQVADQLMPMSSVKIGFDLDPIKSIPHVKTYVEDITKPNCLNIIKRELHNQKADVVLHDGAPNVGATWSKDAYSQSELVLQSLKLATQVLRQGGTFVTKVFRSNDYNSLIWVFNKFFEKVEATKPEASRMTSAEIFVVCMRYLAPNYIDPNLFDAKCVFKDTEADNQMENQFHEITSLGKLLEKRRWRGGYDDNAPQSLYRRMPLSEFLQVENPFPVFLEYNEIEISKEEREKYLGVVKLPEDFEENIKDIKVLGKREIAGLVKWRGKLLFTMRKLKKKEKDEENKENKEEIEVKSDDQLEEAIEDATVQEVQKQRKLKEKKEKQYVKYARNYGETAEEDIFLNEDDELFDIFKHKSLQKIGYVDVEEEEKDPKFYERKTEKSSLKGMELNIEKIYEEKANKQKLKKVKLPKNDQNPSKPAKIIKGEQFELEQTNGEEVKENVKESMTPIEKNKISSILKKKWFDKPIFKDLLETSSSNFKNPLNLKSDHLEENLEDDDENLPINKVPAKERSKKISKKTADLDDFDSEDEANKYLIKVPLSEMEKRRRRLKRQRVKDSKKEGAKDNEFEIVESTTHRLEDYDIDTAAETLALAKKMLRKKDRDVIIDSTYSKYAFEDQEEAPKWFQDDEMAHNHVILPITKEEFQNEKQRLLAINSKTPKKVMEAKIRNFKRAAKKMKKTKQKAEAIFEQEGVTEGIKARQIRSLYKKEVATLQRKRKYIVGKRMNAGPGKKNSRHSKFVDSRSRKDKRRDKDSKKLGVSKRIKKVNGQKKFNRRKRK